MRDSCEKILQERLLISRLTVEKYQDRVFGEALAGLLMKAAETRNVVFYPL
ncbi:MAG: hypothetical protein BWX92_03667 [Deltaproteobacteria bacterium ADurb.Bin135]|jgi:hypothetical protein|nr:MAG: hypothetical protein BWX92_03667 [Deltaproteobacteria bacterium ADurb.Bin135]